MKCHVTFKLRCRLLRSARVADNGQVLPMVGNFIFVRRNRCLAFC